MKLLIMAIFFAISLFAEYKVGQNIEAFELKDQFEKSIKFDKNIKTLIISFEKDTSSIVNEFLKSKKSDFLSSQNTLYIADVSAMPSFVTSFFALPKMKKYNYSMGLIYDEKQAKTFNYKEEKLTVYKLNNLKIESIEFVNSVDNLFK